MSDFKEHRIHIEAERAKLKNTIDVLSQRQHLVKADFEVALQLATELTSSMIRVILMRSVYSARQ